MIYLIALLGALMNRIRGGMLSGSYIAQCIGSTNIFLVLTAISLLACGRGILLTMVILIGVFFGEMLGWGRYIGALGGWEKKPPNEVKFIDEMLDDFGLTPKYKNLNQHAVKYEDIKALKLWGFVGLSIRGAFWGLCITTSIIFMLLITHIFGFNMHIPWTLFILPTTFGCLMGVCYYATIMFSKRFLADARKGWPLGEYVFGGLLFAGCAL